MIFLDLVTNAKSITQSKIIIPKAFGEREGGLRHIPVEMFPIRFGTV